MMSQIFFFVNIVGKKFLLKYMDHIIETKLTKNDKKIFFKKRVTLFECRKCIIKKFSKLPIYN
jgi:hypothetical protein